MDTLSGWTDPPPAARASGDAEPIRVFDTAEDALRCLASLGNREVGRPPSSPAQQPTGRPADGLFRILNRSRACTASAAV